MDLKTKRSAPPVRMSAQERLCYDPNRSAAALTLNHARWFFGNQAPLERIHKRRSTLIDRELNRVLGPFDVTCVVVGSIIGVGIFFVPSEVAEAAGSGRLTMIAWACGGAIALMGALTFAELGGLYPNTGGQYEVLRDAYGSLPAFLFVFCNATAIQTGGLAIIATICAKHLALAASGSVPETASLIVLASALIVGLVAANTIGVKWGAGIQNVTACAKVATLLVVTLLALLVTPGDVDPSMAEPGDAAATSRFGVIGVVFAALVPAFFAFGGWQQALWVAGEVRGAQRNVPRGIVVGMIVVVLTYLLVNWAYLHLLGYQGVVDSEALASDAVAGVWPGGGERVIAAAVALSAFGVLNALLLAGPRLLYGMARDGRFFKLFATASERFGTPIRAILVLGIISLGLLIAAGEDVVGKLLTGVVFVDGIFFVLTGLALFVLRRTRPAAARPMRVPWYPVVPILFVLGELGIVIGAYASPENRSAVRIGLAWIAAGAVLYLACFRGRRAA